MSPALHGFISFDLPAMLAGTLAAVACALLGNFLVLRRLSLMGDAISHSVLPGLVVAFLVSTQRTTLPMFAGALGAGVATVLLIEVLRRFTRLETGAAMGVVFSILFALGVLLLEQAAARHVDLDADCVLNGQLEYIFWTPPAEWGALLRAETLAVRFDALTGVQTGGVPRQVVALAGVFVFASLFVGLLFKELRLAAFDAQLATALGFNAGVLHVALMLLVALAVVASFEAVGSILVIAMLICPPATARLLTDRLGAQILVSLLAALVCGTGGYALAAWAPRVLGTPAALDAAGMMTVCAGGLLTLAIFLGPRHGVAARGVRRLLLAASIAREDLLAMLWRVEEAGALDVGQERELDAQQARAALGGGIVPRVAVWRALRRGELLRAGSGALRLTERGRSAARSLVRTHRLWESYLVTQLGLRPDHVHRTAMELEHVTSAEMLERLERRAAGDVDPHGRVIP